MTYTKHGPFVNNSGPGIDQNFLNDVESSLLALNPGVSTNVVFGADIITQIGEIAVNGILLVPDADNNKSTGSVNGTVSGTFFVTQYITGTVNFVHVYCNNYKSAAAQTIRLPVFSINNQPTMWRVTELQGGKLEALANGVAQTFSIQTGMAAGGGTQVPQTFINSWSFGLCRSGFDSIRITVTGSTPTSCVCSIQG